MKVNSITLNNLNWKYYPELSNDRIVNQSNFSKPIIYILIHAILFEFRETRALKSLNLYFQLVCIFHSLSLELFIGSKLISHVMPIISCHVYKMPTSAACSTHFLSHKAYMLSRRPTHVSEVGPTLRFVLQVSPGATSYNYFSCEELFRAFYYPMRQPSRCSCCPCFARRYLLRCTP